MIIFRTIPFYLAIAGLILATILYKMMSTPPPQATHVVEPARNPFHNTIAASGIVESVDKNISIGAPEEGIVTHLFIKVGEDVKRDQALFQIDNRTLEAQLGVQRANVEVSKANLARLNDQLARLKAVEDKRAVSIEEVRTKENDIEVAAAQLKAAQATVNQTEKLIDRLTVRAPKAGTILQNNIREGEFVSKNSTTMILGDIQHLQVRADIDEQNAGWFRADMKAVAYPKNNTAIRIPLKFDRIEPYVIPKVSLTGASDERVDTRVLQVIYLFDQPGKYHMYVGQQVDLFINKSEE